MKHEIDIFKYIDYRLFLVDAMKIKKDANPYFSFRFIAQHLGLRSPGFFNWVLQGKRNLSNTLSYKVAQLFGLKKNVWNISFAWYDTTRPSFQLRNKNYSIKFLFCDDLMWTK
jgi:hypothetical protein